MKAFITVLAVFISFNNIVLAGEKSPFTDVEFRQSMGGPVDIPTIAVTVNGNEYFLLGVGSVGVKDLMTACQQAFADACEEKFALNFVEVMATAGVQVGDTVDLSVYNLAQHQVLALQAVPVLPENIEDIAFNRELRGQ